MSALYNSTSKYSSFSDVIDDPGGENTVVMFKSCYPNSNLYGNPDDPPTVGENPLRGHSSGSQIHNVSNAKGIYNDMLNYFSNRRDKLFIAITAPPLLPSSTTLERAANARAFNRWLVNDWLKDYNYTNVAVFDFYNVLTTNGGDPDKNDLYSQEGNHHCFNNTTGKVEYITDQGGNYLAYPSGSSHTNNHPTSAGNVKATEEFIPLLNVYYHRWRVSPPTNLSGKYSPRVITLSWDLPLQHMGSPIHNYTVYRGTSRTNLTPLCSLGPGVFSYNDFNILPGRTYYYSISATDTISEGAKSDVVSVRSKRDLNPPRNFSVQVGVLYVNLSWDPPQDDVGSDILYYRIYRGPHSSYTSMNETKGFSTTIPLSYGAKVIHTW